MSIESIAATGQMPASQPVSQDTTQRHNPQSGAVAAGVSPSRETQQVAPLSDASKVRDANESEKAAEPLSEEALGGIVKHLNEMMQNASRDVTFSLDREYDEVVIMVKDSTTNEVVRQIPNEDALKLAEYLDGMLGLIFNEQA